MPQHTQQELEQRYQKLPEVLKEAMYDVDIANKIFAIGKKAALTIEEIGFLAEETGLIILGLTHPEDFTKLLQKRLPDFSREETENVALEINNQILFPLRLALRTAHQLEIAEQEAPKIQEGIVVESPGVATPILPAKPVLPKTAPPPMPTAQPKQPKEIVSNQPVITLAPSAQVQAKTPQPVITPGRPAGRKPEIMGSALFIQPLKPITPPPAKTDLRPGVVETKKPIHDVRDPYREPPD